MHAFAMLCYVPALLLSIGKKLTVCSGILSSPQSPLYGNSPSSPLIYQQGYVVFSLLLLLYLHTGWAVVY